jgi:hypothetical protein
MFLGAIKPILLAGCLRFWKVYRAMVALDNHLRLNNFASLCLYIGSLIRIELCLFFTFYPKIQNACASK